ncbi:MAG: hypothetical protein ACP5XB_32245, partial [Isosphaeraceae bacterium]
AALQRLRAENQSLAANERLDIDTLRTELKRIAMKLPASAEIPAPAENTVLRSTNGSAPHTAVFHTVQNGNRRILSSRPPQKTARSAASRPAPHFDRTGLREAIDRISHCESKADQLVTQLKTAQQDKEHERQVFEKVLTRLQDAFTEAKSEYEIACGSLRPLADRLLAQDEPLDPPAVSSPEKD